MERACETAAVSVLLPREFRGGRQAFRCCAAADAEGARLVVYVMLAVDAGARIFRLEVPLPDDAAPFDLAALAHGLRPTHDDAVLEGRPAVLDAVDTATCVFGTDEGGAAAVHFSSAQPLPQVAPLGEGAAGMFSFFGRGQAAAGIVVISSCLGGNGTAVVSAVHADGKVAVWQLALGGPAASSQFLFQEHLEVGGLRVTKGVVQASALKDGRVRVLVAITTDGNTTAASLWHVNSQRQEHPQSRAVESPPPDGEMLGVQVVGADDLVVFLMRSAADKLVLVYRNRQASDGIHWVRGLVSDVDSARAASAVEDPCLLIADIETGVDQLVISAHTCLLLVVWDAYHPLEVDTPDRRSPLTTLSRTLYRGLTDEDDFARCRQGARTAFAAQLQLQIGDQKPLQIAMSALAGLKRHSHDEAASFLRRDDGSMMAAVLADIDSVMSFFRHGQGPEDTPVPSSDGRLLCASVQRHYCKRIGESRLDLAQDMLYCLAYMLRHRLALQSTLLPTVLQHKYIVPVDQLVRSHMALCYLAGRKFADDSADLEERFSSLRIALPCKYILGSFCVWNQLGLAAITNEKDCLNSCLAFAYAVLGRAIPIADTEASMWNSGVCSLARGLCCPGVNRPEVADKILELLDADSSHIDEMGSGIQWRTEIHKAIGQSYARLGRFSDARRHFLGAAKPLLLAPVAQFEAESSDVNVLAEIDEMMDSLEQDPASALELSSLALRIEAYVESTLQEETGWKARLLSKTFGYALKINDVESAYHAMTSNPDQEKRSNSLKMLVHALHKSKQLEILFDKPLVAAPARFSAADSQSQDGVGVCLHGEVAQILHDRARAGGDEYFKSLYAFHVKQQNMQRAAEAMYALSERCALSGSKTDDPEDYRRAADCLMVAINSLRLCPEPVRWIERTHSAGSTFDADVNTSKGGKRKLGKTGFQGALFGADSASSAEAYAAPDTTTAMGSSSTEVVSVGQTVSFASPLHVSALEGEHALLTARLRLLARGTLGEPVVPNVATSDLVEATVICLLCDSDDDEARHQSDCELAGQLCQLFQADMRSVLHDLAAHYTERSQDPRAAREIGKIAHRLISQHTAHVGESLPSWDLRGSSSSAVDAATDNSNSALHRYFANTIMQMQKQSTTAAHQSIPPWLRSALQGFASLLAFYLNWGHLTEAVRLLLNKLRQADDSVMTENSHVLEVHFRTVAAAPAATGPLGIRLECDTTRRTGNVMVAAVREGGAAAMHGLVQPSDTVLAVWHQSVRQGLDPWLVFEDEPGPDRLARIEALLQRGGPIGLRLRRAGGLLVARCDQRLDWKTSRGQEHFVLSSCVPWNLVSETARRVQHEEEAARDAATDARQAADRAVARGEDDAEHLRAQSEAKAGAALWAGMREDLAYELREQYLPRHEGEDASIPWRSVGLDA